MEMSKKQKVNIGDTVYFVVEHYYHIQDKAGAQMEYLPVEGTVVEFVVGGYKEAKIRSVIDGGVKLFFLKVSDYGKRFYPSREEALAAAIRAADSYDHTWSEITHEKIRRPWEVEAQ